MNSSGMWENSAKWYQICSTMTLTRHELAMQEIRVKLNVEVVVIHHESNHNHL